MRIPTDILLEVASLLDELVKDGRWKNDPRQEAHMQSIAWSFTGMVLVALIPAERAHPRMPKPFFDEMIESLEGSPLLDDKMRSLILELKAAAPDLPKPFAQA
jgi:hypothetical protein